jgi:hypothetical protein
VREGRNEGEEGVGETGEEGGTERGRKVKKRRGMSMRRESWRGYYSSRKKGDGLEEKYKED